MRILVFSWRGPKHPLAGGAEQVMHEHMKGWVMAGHKVTLFVSKMKNLPAQEMLDGVKIVRQGYQYWGVQFAGFLFYLKNKKQFDFVVDQFHGIPFFTPLYVRKPRLAVIQEPAREVWLLNPLTWPLNWIVGLIGYLGEPLVFLPYKNTQFMTGSKSAKDEVANLGVPKRNITVVPHGVEVPKSEIKKSKSKIKTVVHLGVLTKDKGIENSLRCFSILDKKAKFQFWVIGKAETKRYFQRIKRLVGDLGLRGRVKFWGFVSPIEKFELLARAHILINPSIREGWGLVNIEANAMGTPVVAYQSPGLVDSVKDGKSGITTAKNTPEEMAKDVEKLLKDKKKYKELSERAIFWSKQFSWKKSKALSIKLLEEVMRS